MEIPRGWVVLKAKILKGKYGNVWNIQRGGGFEPKNHPWEGYGYFLEQHNMYIVMSRNNSL